ncbi:MULTISPECIES: hypothetical protein [Algoriphagus]|uniref:hypothetical protein n=1 Tax=Algoriphagus TaxID=246875 RepID=UPI0011A772B4|nr:MULTISPECIES: hypothetical protein [Algoriphagus]
MKKTALKSRFSLMVFALLMGIGTAVATSPVVAGPTDPCTSQTLCDFNPDEICCAVIVGGQVVDYQQGDLRP